MSSLISPISIPENKFIGINQPSEAKAEEIPPMCGSHTVAMQKAASRRLSSSSIKMSQSEDLRSRNAKNVPPGSAKNRAAADLAFSLHDMFEFMRGVGANKNPEQDADNLKETKQRLGELDEMLKLASGQNNEPIVNAGDDNQGISNNLIAQNAYDTLIVQGTKYFASRMSLDQRIQVLDGLVGMRQQESVTHTEAANLEKLFGALSDVVMVENFLPDGRVMDDVNYSSMYDKTIAQLQQMPPSPYDDSPDVFEKLLGTALAQAETGLPKEILTQLENVVECSEVLIAAYKRCAEMRQLPREQGDPKKIELAEHKAEKELDRAFKSRSVAVEALDNQKENMPPTYKSICAKFLADCNQIVERQLEKIPLEAVKMERTDWIQRFGSKIIADDER